MKNLTQQELNQVVGGKCPVPVLMGATCTGILGYVILESLREYKFTPVGVAIGAIVGFAAGTMYLITE